MNPDPKPIFILGTGSFAVETADMAGDIPGIRVAGFVENQDRAKCDAPLEGLPVHWFEELKSLSAGHWFACGLGTTHRARFTDQADAAGCRFATLVHPTARVSTTTTLGEGSIVHPGALIASHTRIGRHVCINRGATVGHHAVLDDFVTIGPGVNLAGNGHIHTAVYVGIGATIIDHITIGAGSVIGAGAVVTEAVPDRVLAVGVPARIVKRDIAGK
ncbi:MAG: acetyltransferase [Verrucomicrobiota bacterium]